MENEERERDAECEKIISALIFVSESFDYEIARKMTSEAEKKNTLALRCVETICRMGDDQGVSEGDVFALVQFIKQNSPDYQPGLYTMH